jgi:hypothetical protein
MNASFKTVGYAVGLLCPEELVTADFEAPYDWKKDHGSYNITR